MYKFFIALLISAITYAQVPNIRVSSPTANRPNEVSIAVNPLDPNYISAASNLDYFYYSTNAGLTWSQKRLTSTLGVWGDPVVVYDNSGNLFFAHLSNPIQGYWIDRIVVQKSTDNGITWNDGVGVGLTYPKNQDKEWLCVDRTDSQYHDNVYMSWTEFDDYGSTNPSDSSRILFSRTTDAGVTWSDPVRISDIGGNCIDSDNTVEGAVPAVGPDGEVYVSWAGNYKIYFDRSLDGGVTFGNDIYVTDQPGGWDFDVPGIYRCNGMPITECDISGSPYKGNIYIAWGDQRNGSDNSDVFFIKSTDKGKSWGGLRKVNNDSGNRHQFFPWMTVDQSTGFIYLVFYDRRNTTGSYTEVYLAKSTDGGDTFENIKISESAFNPNAGVFFGDYTNIAAFNGTIYPIWMRLDATELSVWTAAIKDTVTSVDFKDWQNNLNFKLFQNYPNPFNPKTTINYSIANPTFVKIRIFDTLGNEIALLENNFKERGQYEVDFIPDDLNLDLSSGIYFYGINAGNEYKVRKMMYLK